LFLQHRCDRDGLSILHCEKPRGFE